MLHVVILSAWQDKLQTLSTKFAKKFLWELDLPSSNSSCKKNQKSPSPSGGFFFLWLYVYLTFCLMLYLISYTERNSFDFIAYSAALYPILVFFPITFEWWNGHRHEQKSSHFSSECFRNVLRHKFSRSFKQTLSSASHCEKIAWSATEMHFRCYKNYSAPYAKHFLFNSCSKPVIQTSLLIIIVVS